MGPAKRLAVLGLAAVCMYMLCVTGIFPALRRGLAERMEAERAKEETVSEGPAVSAGPETAEPTEAPPPVPTPEAGPRPLDALPEGPELRPVAAVLDSGGSEGVMTTTIQGGLTIKNETHYTIDPDKLLAQGPQVTLPEGEVQILIVHTHGSEAYTQAGLDHYEANDSNRTADTEYNIIRVGDELAKLLEASGLRVLHDREIYDYPSYTGSYTRSGAAVEKYLEERKE